MGEEKAFFAEREIWSPGTWLIWRFFAYTVFGRWRRTRELARRVQDMGRGRRIGAVRTLADVRKCLNKSRLQAFGIYFVGL
jgi:hypothetical protein